MKGKIIVIEGTDCSGKQTQAENLEKRLKESGHKVTIIGFPIYESPTGKIIGGPYLGKKSICEGFFDEGAAAVNPKVSSLYFAADRLYNSDIIRNLIDDGVFVILDRYVYSNMGHQGGKMTTRYEREAMYRWIETLEFDLCDLPIPDIKIFLHMPYENSLDLKKNREELDQHEMDEDHLRNAENAYLEISEIYNFHTIPCVDEKIKSVNQISDEVFEYVINKL